MCFLQFIYIFQMSFACFRNVASVAFRSFEDVSIVRDSCAFPWLASIEYMFLTHVWFFIKWISLFYYTGVTLRHFEALSWSYYSMQVVEALAFLLCNKGNLSMSLIDPYFLPYMWHKSFLGSPYSHSALILPKYKWPSLMLPSWLKNTFQMNK